MTSKWVRECHKSQSGAYWKKQSFLLGFSGNFECRQLVVVFSLSSSVNEKFQPHELWALVTGTVVVYGWKLSLSSRLLYYEKLFPSIRIPMMAWTFPPSAKPSQHCSVCKLGRERCCRHTRGKEEKARSQLWPGTCCILLNTHLSLSDFRALTNFPNVELFWTQNCLPKAAAGICNMSEFETFN